ncbi:MAG: histidine kinase [Lewinellaceae bacterium]|nr:histidine kinase [Lewinellaceae bacterium]
MCTALISVVVLYVSAQPFNFTTYSLGEGLPQSQVFAAIQDSRGYMWFGTQGGGVCRFDGLRFETFTTADGLPSNYISALFEGVDGRIWVAAGSEAGYYDGKKWYKLPPLSAPVNAFGLRPNGQVLMGLGGGKGFVSYRAGVTSPFSVDGASAAPTVYTLFQSGPELWAGTNQGAILAGRSPRRITTQQGLPVNQVHAIACDSDNRLWLATPGGIAVTDPARKKVVQVHRDDRLFNAMCMLADGDGNIWVGTTDHGLLIWSSQNASWTQLGEQQGFPRNHVRSLVCDHTGHVWAGTSGGGVVRFVAQPFRHFDRGDGLSGNRVYAVFEDRSGKIWLSVSQDGLQVFDSSGIRPFTRDSGYLKVKCKTIAEDESGRLWVGTEGKGVTVFDSAGMHVWTSATGLPSDWVQKIVRDPAGNLWLSTALNGLAQVGFAGEDSFYIKRIILPEVFSGQQITSIAVDASGKLWYATQNGVVGWIADGRPGGTSGKKDGLPGVPIRCMAFDAAGVLWVGTKGEGIFRSVGDAAGRMQFESIRLKRPLISKNIYLLMFDPAGNLWAGSEIGVDRISFPAAGAAGEFRHFGKYEGFLGIETCQDAAISDKSGNLWFGTMNGLMKYTPTQRSAMRYPPLLHFQNIALFYKELGETPFAGWMDGRGGLREGLELPYDQNHLSFEFRAVDLDNPDGIRYRWRLLSGQDTAWSPLSQQQSVNFAGLAPGQYSFQVQASSDGLLFSAPLSASFAIRAPFWANWWFRTLCAVLLLGIAALIVYARIRRIRQTEAAKRSRLEMQNQLLLLEQKALQLQMNPHFIFNALNSIQALVGTGDASAARREIAAFSKLMRGILSNSRRQRISLREEAETLDQYLRIEQFCQQNKFSYAIHLPENIDPDEIEIPPMLLQPFVENAVVHGIVSLPYEGLIEVTFQFEQVAETGLLCCTVRDNGVGREKAAALQQERKPGHASVAVEVTRERLAALKNGMGYRELEYRDLKDAEGKIGGTEVTIRLPAAVNY